MARNSPVADHTPMVSAGPGLPCTFATAPENTQGCRRLSDFSRPGLSTSLFKCVSRFSLGAGVRRIIGLRQMLEVEVGVDLRRGNARVPQHLLHRAQVTARLQQVRGKGMPQRVRMHLVRES